VELAVVAAKDLERRLIAVRPKRGRTRSRQSCSRNWVIAGGGSGGAAIGNPAIRQTVP